MSKPMSDGLDHGTNTINGPESFRHIVAVRWADCDPAQIAYTARIPYFALEALDEWWKMAVGASWFEMSVDHHLGMPFVRLAVDFRAPVTPRHPLVCEVRLLQLGTTSVRTGVKAFQDHVLCFEGEFVQVHADGLITGKRPFSPEWRERLQALAPAE